MKTITVHNININGIKRSVDFTEIKENTYEVSSLNQPKLTIKPYDSVFPLMLHKYCVTHGHGIVLAKTPAEAFEKAVNRYWDNKSITFNIP